MDKAKLIELRDTAERRCLELYNSIQETQAELERTRGDFRTYKTLVDEWVDTVPVAEPSPRENVENPTIAGEVLRRPKQPKE